MPESEFEALTAALEPWFNKPLNQLAPEIQDRVLRDFSPTAEPGDIDLVNDNPAIRSIRARLPLPAQTGSAWDSFTPDQRRAVARQWDLQHNPANEAIQEMLWDLQPEITAKLEQLRSEIDLVKAASPSLEFDNDTRESRLVRLRQRLNGIEVAQNELLSAGPAALTTDFMRRVGQIVGQPEAPAGGRAQPKNGDHRPPRTRRTNGRDFRDLDRPLVEQMVDMIKNNPLMSPAAAAEHFVAHATGNSTRASKIARLAKGCRDLIKTREKLRT